MSWLTAEPWLFSWADVWLETRAVAPLPGHFRTDSKPMSPAQNGAIFFLLHFLIEKEANLNLLMTVTMISWRCLAATTLVVLTACCISMLISYNNEIQLRTKLVWQNRILQHQRRKMSGSSEVHKCSLCEKEMRFVPVWTYFSLDLSGWRTSFWLFWLIIWYRSHNRGRCQHRINNKLQKSRFVRVEMKWEVWVKWRRFKQVNKKLSM